MILGSRQWSQRPDEAIDDRVAGDNLMYTVHFYACDHRDAQREEARRAYDAGLALFVTEWGATPADGGDANPTVCADEATLWHDWMDERQIGWAAWKLDGCDDSSCLLNSKNAPAAGGWSDQWLNGHARFVVERLTRWSGNVGSPAECVCGGSEPRGAGRRQDYPLGEAQLSS